MERPNVMKPKTDVIQKFLLDVRKLYTPADYAKKLGCTRNGVYHKIKTGIIKPEHVYDLNGTTMIYHPN